MAAAARRPLSDFLSHDITPVDPATLKYEPSSGAPRRDVRRQTYVHHGILLEEPARDVERRINAVPDRLPYHPKPNTFKENPPKAKAASDFFQGTYTTPNVQPNRAERIRLSERFMDPEELQYLREREQKQKASLRRVGEELQQSQAEHRRRQRQAEEDLAQQTINHDPWSRNGVADAYQVTPGGRKIAPRRNFVARGEHYQAGAPGNYIDKAFCKAGSGAPNVDASGRIVTQLHRKLEKGKHHAEGPADAFVAQHFGKVGPGGLPRRSNDGRVVAKKDSIVTLDKHHQQGEDPYHKVFGKPGPGAPPPASNGYVRAPRTSYLEKDLHHREGPDNAYVDQVFRGEGPKRTTDGYLVARRSKEKDMDPGFISKPARRAGVKKIEHDPEFHDRVPHPLTNVLHPESNAPRRSRATRAKSQKISNNLLSDALNNVARS